MAKVIEFTVETHIATESQALDLNQFMIDLSDFITGWAEKNNSKHVCFDSMMEVCRLSKKDYETIETVDECVAGFARDQKLKKNYAHIS